jgi:predicted MFS family arabinose efflux permease
MHQRWLILAVLTFARTVIGFQFQSVAAIAPFLIDQLQISYAALGTLIGLYLFPGAAVAIPGGVLAQRFGDKWIACIGLVAMACGALVMASVDNFALLAAGRIVSGTGAVFLNVIVTKMATDWFQGQNTAVALAILIASWPIGIAIALVLLPALAKTASWPLAIYATMAASVVAFALVALFYRAPAGAASDQRTGIRFDLTRRELSLAVLAGLVWTFYNIGFIIVLAFGPEFLIASGDSATRASAIVSTVGWLIIPTLPLGAWLAERTGRPYITMIGSFLIAAVLIGLVASVGPSALLFALIGLIFGPPGGLIMAMPGQAVRAERRAIAIGVYFTCYYVGMGVLPTFAGYARDLTGSAAAPLWFATAMLVVATLALLQFRLIQSRVLPTA